jgi:hypothetical protein
MQDMFVPITTRTRGNCHWNRDTVGSVLSTGFEVTYTRDLGGIFLPMLLLQATRV